MGTDGTLDTNNMNVSGVVLLLSAVTVSGGIVTATVGDGSQLTGVSGFATALSSDQTSSIK